MMDVVIHEDGEMYVGLVSGWYKVVALFTDEDACNIFLGKNHNCGVLAEEGKVIIVALNGDCGLKSLPETKYDVYGAPV